MVYPKEVKYHRKYQFTHFVSDLPPRDMGHLSDFRLCCWVLNLVPITVYLIAILQNAETKRFISFSETKRFISFSGSIKRWPHEHQLVYEISIHVFI